MKTTTKVIYQESNSCGTQYAPANCSGYGTKWRVSLRRNYYGEWQLSGIARLLNPNWTIDMKKVEKSYNELNSILGY